MNGLNESTMLVALANFLVCTAIGYVTLCRINVMQGDSTAGRVRAAYVLLLVAATASGFSPMFFGEWPTRTQLILTCTFLVVVAIGAPEWRSLPEYARRQPRKPEGTR